MARSPLSAADGGWFLTRAQQAASRTPAELAAEQPIESEDEPQHTSEPGQGTAAVEEHHAAAESHAAAATNCSAPQTSGFALAFRAKQWLELSASEDARLDSRELTMSAWVRLSPSPASRDPAGIQTIFSSKSSGCDADQAHYGMALFANAWNTESGQLFLSWGNSHSGCEELASAHGLVPPGKWTFVAATIDSKGDAGIYVNGKLAAHTAKPSLGERRIAAGPPIERGVKTGGPRRIRIGAHTDDTHALRGHLASVAIHPAALEGTAQHELMCGKHSTVRPRPLALLAPELRSQQKRRKLDKLLPNAKGAVVNLTVPSISVDAMSEPPGTLQLVDASETDVEERRVPLVSPVTKLASTVDYTFPGAHDSSSSSFGGTEREAIGNGWGGGGGGGRLPRPRLGGSHSSSSSSSSSSSNQPAANGWPLGWLPGKPIVRPSMEVINASDALAYERREQVKGVMRRAWNAYRNYAWGADEIKPVSNRSHDWLRLGATLVDCLDNLWIMGMMKEFKEAREWVATRLIFTNTARSISMFETVIRILGGLLSAYELSKDRMFLTKAQDLADRMMYAFDARGRHGLPCTTISLTAQSCAFAQWTGQAAILAEFGTIQLEFKYLAYHTGQRKYWDVVERIMEHLKRVDKPHGLYPVFMSPSSGSWTSPKITLGALGDSFYEYLIKQWLITNKQETYLREMFDDAMVNIAKLLVQKSSPSGYVYIADWSGSSLTHKMDHLACFAGAMYAVGAQDNGKYDEEYMALAAALSETCFRMYSRTKTGLSPEFTTFVRGSDMATPRTASYNIGRPEAAEAWFYMWYYTRDPKWREMGWKVFEAFEKYAATGSGWTALPDVENPIRSATTRWSRLCSRRRSSTSTSSLIRTTRYRSRHMSSTRRPIRSGGSSR